MAPPDHGSGDQPRREKKTHTIEANQCRNSPPDVYKEFVKTMTEIWKQNADSDGVLRNVSTEKCIETVMKQFQGWDGVKQGFMNFTQGRSPFHDNPIPLGFLQRVKVKELLRNSPELLEEFIKNYLPPGLTALLSDDGQYCRCLETSRVRKGVLRFTPADNHSLEGIRVKATNRRKALLAEANEINKTRLNAGDKYNDPDMHEGISSIISYACASEDTEMMTWTKLVQPFLSVNCLWPDLKENVVPKEACEHCGISKDYLNSIPDALSANKPPLSSKIGDFPTNKSKECHSLCDGFNAEIEEGEFVPDAENIHTGPSTCDHGNEPEEQHESRQDSKRTTKPSGVNGETCCSIVVLRRLYQILYDRLKVAKSLSRDGAAKRLPRNPCARDPYEEFKEKLRSLLDRSIDHCKFEDFCLKFLGSESFELFTLDRLINRVINQLRVISSSDEDNSLLQFLEKLRRPTLPKNLSQHTILSNSAVRWVAEA